MVPLRKAGCVSGRGEIAQPFLLSHPLKQEGLPA